MLKIDEGELLKVLQDLIRINSVNPNISQDAKGESEITHFIGAYLEDLGLKVEYQKVSENRENVIGILKGIHDKKKLMLNGHMDTVGIKGMEIDPFNPIYKEGRIYGRGASDMKGGIAAQILTVRTLIENEVPLQGNLILSYVVDEEYASIGAEKLMEDYSADAAIISEPSSLQILLTHGGFAWATVNIIGKSAHGSLPEAGIDAITNASKFLVKLDRYQKEVLSQKHYPLLGTPSVHASFIEGGLEMSTYPDQCNIKLERRLMPDENKEVFLKEIKQVIKEVKLEDKSFEAEHDLFFFRHGIEISKDQPIIRSLNEAVQKVLKKEPEYMGFRAWTDAGILTESGIPTTIFGPEFSGAHEAIESVDFNSVVKTSEILYNTISNYLS